MEATIVQDTAKHYPVLLKEIISIITPQYGGTFIDCTLGQGGYTHEILKYGKTKVIGIDRDIDSSFIAKKISDKFPSRFIFKNLRFSNLKNLKLKNENIKGVIFDLGFSMTQIKDQKKGLSFNSTGELNMKMGMNDFSAKDVINRLKDKELEKIFRYFGEEKEAKQIVKSIVKHRQLEQIDTQRLVKIIENCKRKKNYKTHSATKVFQALRIFVNKEITELINGLINAAKVLKKDGVLVVVTFHSLEDKIVKYFFKSLSENKSISRYQPKMDQKKVAFKMPKRKPIIPLEKELKENPPSRSAKLRYLVKREDVYEVETDIFEKFKNLIEIENIGLKL